MSSNRSRQMFLLTSLRRDLLLPEKFRVHPRHQAFLVIGTVEDADAAALRQRDHAAPHEIVIEFVRGRLLERMDLAALRIDAFEDALDGAVLARRIHALEDHQQRPAVLRVEPLLKIVEPLPVGFENLFGLVLVETALLVGLVRLEMELARSVEAERRDKGLQLGGERLRRLLAHEVNSSGRLNANGILRSWQGQTRSSLPATVRHALSDAAPRSNPCARDDPRMCFASRSQ